LDDFIEGDPTVVVFKRIVVKKNDKKQVVLNIVKADWTLARLKEELKAKDAEFAESDNFVLTFNGKTLDDDAKKLFQYGFKENAIVRTIFRVAGGAAIPDGQRNYPLDVSKWPKKIKPSKKECFSSSVELGPGRHHAEIPCCKSVTSAEAAFRLLKNELFYNGAGELKCKFKTNCRKPISFGYYAWLGQLNLDEEQEFRAQFDINALISPNPELRKCPNEDCGAYVQRPLSMLDVRVRCVQCLAYDWCWSCGGKWKSVNHLKCGNEDCDPLTFYYNLLVNCETATITNIENVPVLRLCPMCNTLIQWTKDCKHMTCKMCNHQFCISCLKQWKTNDHLLETCEIYQY